MAERLTAMVCYPSMPMPTITDTRRTSAVRAEGLVVEAGNNVGELRGRIGAVLSGWEGHVVDDAERERDGRRDRRQVRARLAIGRGARADSELRVLPNRQRRHARRC